MICFIIVIAAIITPAILWYVIETITEYMEEREYIAYLKLRKEWLANRHPCKYHHKNDLITCHEKEGKENCINCPYIPFEEECKYFNI